MSNLKPTKYPLRDKQVIASAFGQLRINFTCNFKVFQNALVASRLGQFCENFENTREIDLIHKWRLINYSSVFMRIVLTSLTLKQKFF